MIAALNTSPSIKAPVRPAAPGGTPAPASDPMDFATIDTPEKALCLPALNPLAWMGFNSVITACAMSSCGLHGALGMSFSEGARQTRLDGQYRLDINTPGSLALGCSGKIGGADYQESWSVGLDGAIRMQGKIGNSSEDLVMSTNGQGAQLKGHIGSVEVDLHGDVMKGLDGTLGGKAAHLALRMKPDPTAMYSVESNGTLADKTFQFAGKLAPDPAQKPAGVQGTGAGSIAGYYVTLSQQMVPELPAR